MFKISFQIDRKKDCINMEHFPKQITAVLLCDEIFYPSQLGFLAVFLLYGLISWLPLELCNITFSENSELSSSRITDIKNDKFSFKRGKFRELKHIPYKV